MKNQYDSNTVVITIETIDDKTLYIFTDRGGSHASHKSTPNDMQADVERLTKSAHDKGYTVMVEGAAALAQ